MFLPLAALAPRHQDLGESAPGPGQDLLTVTWYFGGNLFAKGNQKGSKKGSGEIEPARKKESRDG